VMEEVPIVTPLAWRKDLVPARSGLNRVPRLRKDLHACTAEPVECPLLEANTVTLRTNPSIDIANHVARRKHPLGVFIGNRNLERFLDSHDELYSIKSHVSLRSVLPNYLSLFIHQAYRGPACVGNGDA